MLALGLMIALLANANAEDTNREFMRTRGTEFVVNKEIFYPNGFNAYWLMQRASEPMERHKVSDAMRQASELGLNVVRTWAFSDGGDYPLQYSPGSYNQAMFQGLDFVIAEAKRYGIYVVLSLVNNFEDFGGRKQYVEWAREEGQDLTSVDDFYTSSVVKGYYKNHVKNVLTRSNTVTGVAYKDEPNIFAWELINEPFCLTDLSGDTLHAWIVEMAGHVKSIDNKHLLEAGLEGFYGNSLPSRRQFNPTFINGLGSDFILDNLAPGIDFATIHAYPDNWLPGTDDEAQLYFLQNWIKSHSEDASVILKKPLLIAEFGKSLWVGLGLDWETRMRQRDVLYATVYSMIYASARRGGACSGGLFWQLLLGYGMDGMRDGFEIVVSESPLTVGIIAHHSTNLRALPHKAFDTVSYIHKRDDYVDTKDDSNTKRII